MLSDYSTDQIQAAKDFIWDHLEDVTRRFVLYINELNEADRKKLYSHKCFAICLLIETVE
ncbi:MAG: hypothetical protein WDM78_20745 [Puia sp.]